jgi:hypothetical protein
LSIQSTPTPTLHAEQLGIALRWEPAACSADHAPCACVSMVWWGYRWVLNGYWCVYRLVLVLYGFDQSRCRLHATLCNTKLYLFSTAWLLMGMLWIECVDATGP